MFLILLLSFFNCYFQTADLQTFKISGYTQGTTYQVTYYHTSELVRKKDIDSILISLDSSLSIYKSYSLINKFNHSASGIKTDSHLLKVAKKSIEVYHKTDGAFDFTVQPLVQAWGFGPTKPASLPDSAAIKAILPCVGSDKIKLRKDFLSKQKSCTGIDVNGIAQGYSVDVLADYLNSRGITNYFIEIGGEIVAKGKKPSGDYMTIGIEGPSVDNDQYPIMKKLLLKEGAVTTSGNYRKFYQSGQKKISHLIDPKSGFYVQNELISVTVYAKDAITADGYDNALMVMGLKKSMAFLAKNKNLQAYFIYHKPDNTMADTATAGFYKLMK